MSPTLELVGPSSHFYVSQRLRLHYVDWGNPDKPLLLLVHGGRDHARSWDWVARALRDHFHVVAPDLRGHGDSAWAVGSGYALTDFVLDIAQLVEALDEDPVTIIGHSLGGAVSLMFTGTFPEKVGRLVAIEGLGPPPAVLRETVGVPGWKRVRDWVERMQKLAARKPRHYPSIDAAAARMQEANPFLSPEQARHLTIHGVARNEDGTYSWKFDNYVHAFSPIRLTLDEVDEQRARITCPVLLVRGTESWASDPAKDGRMAPFQDARSVNVEGAGHWVHHDRLDVFLGHVREFLGIEGGAS
ncbi:MAG: alpha/beta fold hydrolase [Myxococcota bacterium]